MNTADFKRGQSLWIVTEPTRSNRGWRTVEVRVTSVRGDYVHFKSERHGGKFSPDVMLVEQEYSTVTEHVFTTAEEAADYPAKADLWGAVRRLTYDSHRVPRGLSTDALRAFHQALAASEDTES